MAPRRKGGRRLPRRSEPSDNPKELLDELQLLLDAFASELEKPDLRLKVRALIPSLHKLRDLGSSLQTDAPSGARERILLYMQKYVGTVVDGDELLVVSGIGEWARRVRELRVESGWRIYTGATLQDMISDEPALGEEIRKAYSIEPANLRPDQYLLATGAQDRDAAHRWNTLSRIRKSNASVSDKIRTYFLENVGKEVTGEELRYLAKDKSEWARRSRELRTVHGWAVVTKQSGRPDLPVGVYVLEHDRQAEPHDRDITDAVRVEVLTRDGFKCTQCGWKRTDFSPDDPRRFLELHHIVAHRNRGSNEADNLITLCNVHHDEIHRKERKQSL
jgi:hypothetical protein